jgi:CheY-like chemotaxis protein
MITNEAFERDFREALSKFHDPDYRPPEALCTVLGCQPQDGRAAVRSAILQGIERLKPPVETPKSAYASLIYDLLWSRFQLRLTQEEAAYQLNVSRRTINRLQHSAAEALCAVLWERSQGGGSPAGVAPQEDHSPVQAPDWNAQLQRELNSLEAKAPSATADVGEVIDNVLEIASPMLRKQAVEVKTMSIQPNLIVTVHPVLLHQILLSTLLHLAEHIADGEIALYARLEDGNAKITLTGRVAKEGLSEAHLVQDLPAATKIGVETFLDDAHAFVWITAPAGGKVTVLVVDDNEDMARFYRDCTIGTRYHIAHIAQGENLAATVASLLPDVIVLDIMLPDIDGWRLLMRLHENPGTRHIPVIICTVIREEDLARSLGAACYLAKPVLPAQFIQALDRTCPPAAEDSSIPPASSAEAGAATARLP